MTRLEDALFNENNFDLEGNILLYTADGNGETSKGNRETFEFNLKTKEIKKIGNSLLTYSPKGNYLAGLKETTDDYVNTLLFVKDRKGKTISSTTFWFVNNILWSPDERYIVVFDGYEAEASAYLYDIKNNKHIEISYNYAIQEHEYSYGGWSSNSKVFSLAEYNYGKGGDHNTHIVDFNVNKENNLHSIRDKGEEDYRGVFNLDETLLVFRELPNEKGKQWGLESYLLGEGGGRFGIDFSNSEINTRSGISVSPDKSKVIVVEGEKYNIYSLPDGMEMSSGELDKPDNRFAIDWSPNSKHICLLGSYHEELNILDHEGRKLANYNIPKSLVAEDDEEKYVLTKVQWRPF